MDIDVFFPGPGEKISEEVAEVCGSCTVRKECETAGMGEYGIWGGLSERARRVRRARGRRRRPEETAPAGADSLPRDGLISPGEGASTAA